MAERPDRADAWTDLEDEAAEQPFKPLSREEAQALMAQQRSVTPWGVVGMQFLTGLSLAALAWGLLGGQVVASVLYGAAAVVVPGALMARGITGRYTRMSAGAAVVSFMLWEIGKIAVSVAMLAMAPKVVPDLSWPAMLVALVVCLKVYWVALAWRGRKKS